MLTWNLDSEQDHYIPYGLEGESCLVLTCNADLTLRGPRSTTLPGRT
jgi:hypothetical protein